MGNLPIQLPSNLVKGGPAKKTPASSCLLPGSLFQAQFNLHSQESMSCTAGDVSNQSMPNHTRRLVKKLKLLKRHYKAHFKFANEHKDMTVEDWKNVVWSDETKINFFGLDGKQFCWIKNAGFNSKLVRPTVKFGSSSIMIWGCMTWEGVGGMCLVLGSMNSDQYIDILNDKLLKTISDLQLQHAYTDIMFQQDNDLKHMSKKTITWLESNSIKVMQWLAQLPDLNPIEHLWHHPKMQLSQYSMIAKSRDELLKRCEAEWTEITPETCRMLIESMPDHIKVVLKAKGGNTKY
ncbi:putative transposase [Ustilago hordei]|uniref:putative transposase n=1 Tax=Ustilago hordei TaxID=120017 RepID=UPI001A583309|nr:putative transposase [Ustilago hordei]SYW81732.1 probable transposase [Ustilago hordei]